MSNDLDMTPVEPRGATETAEQAPAGVPGREERVEAYRAAIGEAALLPEGDFGYVAERVLAVADSELAPLLAQIAELEAEVERQSVLLRAVKDSHLDPARAILQADVLAGEAIIRAHAAEAQVSELRAEVEVYRAAMPALSALAQGNPGVLTDEARGLVHDAVTYPRLRALVAAGGPAVWDGEDATGEACPHCIPSIPYQCAAHFHPASPVVAVQGPATPSATDAHVHEFTYFNPILAPCCTRPHYHCGCGEKGPCRPPAPGDATTDEGVAK